MIQHCGLIPGQSSQQGLVVHTAVDFFSSIAFPAIAELALKVVKLGTSSVTYEVALFEKGVENVKSVCTFTHVFVDRETAKPAVGGMSQDIRTGLQQLLVNAAKL